MRWRPSQLDYELLSQSCPGKHTKRERPPQHARPQSESETVFALCPPFTPDQPCMAETKRWASYLVLNTNLLDAQAWSDRQVLLECELTDRSRAALCLPEGPQSERPST